MLKNYQILNYVNTNQNEMLLIMHQALINFMNNEDQKGKLNPKNNPCIMTQSEKPSTIDVIINHHNNPSKSIICDIDYILKALANKHQEILKDHKLMNYLKVIGVEENETIQYENSYWETTTQTQLNIPDIIKFVTQPN